MKKLIILPFLIFFATSLIAQESFIVPEITDIQKQWRVTSQMNGLVVNNINFAKSMGKTVEEAGQFAGNQFKLGWNKENGWEGFARGCLKNWIIFRPDNKIEIVEQSASMLKFKSKIPNEWLKKNGPINNVSHDDYMTWVKVAHKVIGDHLDASISFDDIEDGIIVTIRKK